MTGDVEKMSEKDQPTIAPIEVDATIVTQLKTLAHEKPDKPAFIFYDKDLNKRVLTRQEVWDKSKKFAAILRRHGITKGDIVCNTLVNSPERLITCFGTLTAGSIPMHGQVFRADGEDLIQSLKESKCKAILIDPKDQIGASTVLDRIKYVDVKTRATRYSGLPDLTQVVNIRTCGVDEPERFITSIDEEEEMFIEEDISQDDIAAIFTTSGTTGFSKLVQHTHFTLFTFAMTASSVMENNPKSTTFNMQSMGWVGGFPYHYPRVGHTRVCIDHASGTTSDMGSFLVRVFNQEDVHSSIFLSKDLQCVIDSLKDGRTLEKRIPLLVTGGGPIHTATIEALGKITDKIVIAYGGTEFAFCSFIEVTDKSQFQDMCTGKPIPTCDVKIVGEDGKEVPFGQTGEILVLNQTLFKGYLNNPTKTREAFSDGGFYKTGDMGYFDDKGLLFVLCRKADAITKAGYIHYPGWMEKLVNEIPGIEKSVVIGVPDPIHHEEICLCMKLLPGAELTEEEARGHCKKLFVTDEKSALTPLPQYYLFFDDFIVNSNQKVDRRLMKLEVCKRLNIQV